MYVLYVPLKPHRTHRRKTNRLPQDSNHSEPHRRAMPAYAYILLTSIPDILFYQELKQTDQPNPPALILSGQLDTFSACSNQIRCPSPFRLGVTISIKFIWLVPPPATDTVTQAQVLAMVAVGFCSLRRSSCTRSSCTRSGSLAVTFPVIPLQ